MFRVDYARQLFYREKDVFSMGCKVPATILFKQQTEFSAMAQMCTTYQKVFLYILILLKDSMVSFHWTLFMNYS